MKSKFLFRKFRHPLLWTMVLILVGAQACSSWLIPPTPGESTAVPKPTATVIQPTPIPQSEITFRVETPANAPPDQPVFLNILDEVTGLALHAQTFALNQDDDRHHSLTMTFPLGAVVKYRYSRQAPSSMVEEHISDGRQMRYRLYHVEGPGIVQDVVTRWTDTEYQGVSGRISGQVLDAVSGASIPNILVVAGGSSAITTSDGSYLIEGLPPGTQNMVAYAMDGSYQTFQQGAVVAAESTTPAELRLLPAEKIKVTFQLDVPPDTVPAVPIRLAGNLYQLGNTFADLAGGVNTLAARMPALAIQPDGSYQLELELPAGTYLRYFYTLGDGFWNTELSANGERRIRELVLPDQDTLIHDQVSSWHSGSMAPITFDLSVPADTPPGDVISIQFNPFFGWMEPIPMWRIGENRWAFVLNSPLGNLSSLQYRFCRNEQCGAADDLRTAGPQSSGFPLTPGIFRQNIVEEVNHWAWWGESDGYAQPPREITARGSGFIAGVQFQPHVSPSALTYMPQAFSDVQATGANWVFLTPTWTYTRNSPPLLEPVNGPDAMWLDLVKLTGQAKAAGLTVALAPQARFNLPLDSWWASANRDFPWWVLWFERYRSMILHNADLAASNGAGALVLGGDWLSAALPGGTLPDGSPSGVPGDAETRWRDLIQEVRTHFSGVLIWRLPYDQAAQNPPPFLDAVDMLLVDFTPSLSANNTPSVEGIAETSAAHLDQDLLPLYQSSGKPLLLDLGYPSADGASTACLPAEGGSCLDWDLLARPQPDVPQVDIDLNEQAAIYDGALLAVMNRAWIAGVISDGYYAPAALRDKSASIHGKPAQDVLRTWFQGLRGGTAP